MDFRNKAVLIVGASSGMGRGRERRSDTRRLT